MLLSCAFVIVFTMAPSRWISEAWCEEAIVIQVEEVGGSEGRGSKSSRNRIDPKKYTGPELSTW